MTRIVRPDTKFPETSIWEKKTKGTSTCDLNNASGGTAK